MNQNYLNFLLELQKYSDNFSDFFSNIFTMREIGNKTHGDMAEIALTKFINTYLSPNYRAKHVGKDLFRNKIQEEDIVVTTINNEEIPISIKAYGVGPLQLSTDKEHAIFPFLESFNKLEIIDSNTINTILNYEAFSSIFNINVLPLIYNEDNNTCNIMVFNNDLIKKKICKIKKILPGGKRKYPIYVFLDNNDNYLFEVRYGGKDANALQRGVWTHTKKAENCFLSISNGWVSYKTRQNLLDVLSLLMIADNNTINNFLLQKESNK